MRFVCREYACTTLVTRPGMCPRHTRPSARALRTSHRRWRDLRAAVIARDGFACSDCGYGAELEVHHVDGDAYNNDPRNLVTLCSTCHDRATAALHRPGGSHARQL